MKVYDLSYSPYSSRVRMQAGLKGLPIDFVPPPLPLGSPEFKARFALGRIPILELDDGALISESWAIMEYLEDVFPEPSLRPEGALDAARMRMLGRAADLYLAPPIFELFKLLKDPQAKFDEPLGQFRTECDKVSRLLKEVLAPPARALNLGDVALVTVVQSATVMVPLLAGREAFADFPELSAWWQAVSEQAAIGRVIEEMDQGFKGFLRHIGRM